MRLRSNHVLDPVSEWQPTRRRRGTRGTSAQPEAEAVIEPANSTSARPARKGRPAKKGGKKAPTPRSVPEEEAPIVSPVSSPLSPVPSPLVIPSIFASSPTPAVPHAAPMARRRVSPVIPLVPPNVRPRVLPRFVSDSPFITQNTMIHPFADPSMTSAEEAPNAHETVETQNDQPSAVPSARPNDRRRCPLPSTRRSRRAFQYGSATELLAQARARAPAQAQAINSPETRPATRFFPYNYPAIPRRALGRVPWSLDTPNHPGIYLSNMPITLPNGLANPPNNSEMFFTPRSELTTPEDGSRKRNRHAEDETPVKRYKSAQPMTPSGSSIRPRGNSRTTHADRTRRRQAESAGRIHRTMLRFPQLLAQQEADARSASPSEDTSTNDQAASARQVVPPRRSSLPSALPETANQPGWRRWIFDGVSQRLPGLLGRRSSPQVADVSHLTESEQQQMEVEVEAEGRQESENEDFVTAPSSALQQSSAVLPTRDSLTPASRVAAASPKMTLPIPKNYDLFSRGYDAAQRARWMSNPLPSSTAHSDPPQSPPQQIPAAQPEQGQESGVRDSTKRKRQPSPDVIPNPPGCSYGLNDEYFIYDDDDWAAQERDNPDVTPTKVATNESPEEERRVSKKVRIERPANFNHQGHFETPGWSTSSESSSSTQTTPLGPQPTGASARQATVESVEEDHRATRHGTANMNGLTGFNDRELLKKARDQAEQYKPKTPSRLRSAHRFSSSSNFGASDFQRESMYNSEDAVRRRRMRKRSLATACPTGDFRHITWPEFDTWVNRLACYINDDVVDWVNNMPQRQDKQKLRTKQDNFDIRYQEELDKKKADPNYVPQMWFPPK